MEKVGHHKILDEDPFSASLHEEHTVACDDGAVVLVRTVISQKSAWDGPVMSCHAGENRDHDKDNTKINCTYVAWGSRRPAQFSCL